jgi:hypothetical protein
MLSQYEVMQAYRRCTGGPRDLRISRPLRGTSSTRCWTRSAFEFREPLEDGLRTIFKRNRAPLGDLDPPCQPSQAQLALSLSMRLRLFNLRLTKPTPPVEVTKVALFGPYDGYYHPEAAALGSPRHVHPPSLR